MSVNTTGVSQGASGIILDQTVQTVLSGMGSTPYVDLEALPLVQALAIGRMHGNPAPPPAGAEDVTIGGFQGAAIRLRLYRPPSEKTKLPGLIHLHGGGFVTGSIEQDDARCMQLAREASCIVVSVAYRLAPEHPFPTGVEDAFAAWLWMTSHGVRFGVDRERCAISGSSAGGHLAVGVTLLARAHGGPMPMFQLLSYPVIDPGLDSASYRSFADGPFLTRTRMAWYWKQYAGSEIDRGNALLAPLVADFRGLPPAHIITAEYDVLRDEGEDFAAHLRTAGIEAEVKRYPAMVHGFISIVPNHPASIAALRSSAAALRKAFDTQERRGSCATE